MQLLQFVIVVYLAVGLLTALIVDLANKYSDRQTKFSQLEKLMIIAIWPSIYYRMLS